MLNYSNKNEFEEAFLKAFEKYGLDPKYWNIQLDHMYTETGALSATCFYTCDEGNFGSKQKRLNARSGEDGITVFNQEFNKAVVKPEETSITKIVNITVPIQPHPVYTKPCYDLVEIEQVKDSMWKRIYKAVLG